MTYRVRQAAAATGAVECAGAGSSFDLQELYAAMKHPPTEQQAEPHPALKPTLRPYQLRAARWMQRRESEAGARPPQLHPLLLAVPCACGTTLYYSEWTGAIAKEPTYSSDGVPGGVLCDEMGLGKTVELLHLVLSRPRNEWEAGAGAGAGACDNSSVPQPARETVVDGPADEKQMRCSSSAVDNTRDDGMAPVAIKADDESCGGEARVVTPAAAEECCSGGGGEWLEVGGVVEVWCETEGDWFDARIKDVRVNDSRYTALPSVVTWFQQQRSSGVVKRELGASPGAGAGNRRLVEVAAGGGMAASSRDLSNHSSNRLLQVLPRLVGPIWSYRLISVCSFALPNFPAVCCVSPGSNS